MRLVVILIGFIALITFSCSAPNDEISVNSSEDSFAPGLFSYSLMNGLGKAELHSQSANESDTITFNLGELKASRDFYFILKNIGGSNITDISLTSDNPTFAISPAAIDILYPDSVSSYTAVIRISAIHGVALEGFGFEPLMPMGENNASVNIVGLTIDSDSSTTEIEVISNIQINAQVMDIALLDDTLEIDLYHPPEMGFSGLGETRGFTYNHIPIIVNTGNVEIDVIDLHMEWDTLLTTIQPQDSWTLLFPPNKDGSERLEGFIRLDGNNTITDQHKLPLQPDGTSFFSIYKAEP